MHHNNEIFLVFIFFAVIVASLFGSSRTCGSTLGVLGVSAAGLPNTYSEVILLAFVARRITLGILYF